MSRKENYFNTVFKNSIIDIEQNPCAAYKISDIGAEATISKPFDGFGTYQGQPMYWEGKRTTDVKAFNIKNLFEGERGHQMKYMEHYSTIPNTKTWIVLFCYIPRKSRVYVFTYDAIKKVYESGEISIKKKILEQLPYVLIKKDRVDKIEEITYHVYSKQMLSSS